ncbi:MAG: hypothetical protein K2O24_04195 [Muribaculaceae bacterium]|nr:hypothetical protein [Muribaculaceae bacterium]
MTRKILKTVASLAFLCCCGNAGAAIDVDDEHTDSPRHVMITTELGSSIDLGSHDMSTFDVDLAAAYTNPFIRALGLGIGVHRSFGSDNTFIPIYALFQSSFRTRPSLFFLSLKVGYSFSTVGNSAMYGDTSAMAGLGINLMTRRNFRSHIIFGFGFRHYNRKHQTAISLDTQNVGLANLSFGVSF